MIKRISFLAALGMILWSPYLQAQEQPVLNKLLPDETVAAKKVEFKEPLQKDIDFAARNYRPERLKELNKAVNFIKRRQVELVNLNLPEEAQAEVPKAKNIDVRDPKKVKEFLNSSFTSQLDEPDTIADKEIEAAKDTPLADVNVPDTESPLK